MGTASTPWVRSSMVALVLLGGQQALRAQIAVRGEVVHTMAGPPLEDAVILCRDGKIAAIGPAEQISVPSGYEVLTAAVVTPGLIDAHTVIGVAGYYNDPQADQEQHESSEPVQPELRALDAYNSREVLVEWVRGFGVTTLQTGHAPLEVVPGQLFLVKTAGSTADEAAIRPFSAVAATLSEAAKKDGGSPGTRSKMMALLRSQFVKAAEYRAKRAAAESGNVPPRDLRLEALAAVLAKEVPLVLTAHRAQDIASALRFAREFDVELILDGAAEAYLLLDEIRAAGVPVLLHPTMKRAVRETENLSFETAAKLHAAGIPFALQSGYESYVPKTRVVLFEAAIAAAHGLGFEAALASITSQPAQILGIDHRVGSLRIGLDADLALYDGDPFEYTTHCISTVVDGQLVSTGERQR